jgi:thymidylate synthase ThyX
LVDFDPLGEDKVLAAICQPLVSDSEHEILRLVDRIGAEDRLAMLKAYVGDRQNRRHRPGRAFERTDYRFEIVSDYGAFRDLQRHRLLTIDWQQLGCSLGYDVPELVEESGLAEEYVQSMSRSAELFDDMRVDFPEQSRYAVALAFRIRYSMQMNAREAMHVVELRSGPQGHPTYRTVAQEMHRLIADQAGHKMLAEAMSFVDHGSTDLERLDAEERAQSRRSGQSGASNRD